ncbi:hypothetical protein KJK34_08745 [Flavobacterium sp. D11R37]|uniref:hypothetical protein n=1 Tax=Flavobacterium coralii TaxID=2838017 RepID=UPI001CA74558|nr:hypothetical protein [Flavobacterium coralii]MBY8962834.1 hypothetical protein [Flavobacterium coralii]
MKLNLLTVFAFTCVSAFGQAPEQKTDKYSIEAIRYYEQNPSPDCYKIQFSIYRTDVYGTRWLTHAAKIMLGDCIECIGEYFYSRDYGFRDCIIKDDKIMDRPFLDFFRKHPEMLPQYATERSEILKKLNKKN